MFLRQFCVFMLMWILFIVICKQNVFMLHKEIGVFVITEIENNR